MNLLQSIKEGEKKERSRIGGEGLKERNECMTAPRRQLTHKRKKENPWMRKKRTREKKLYNPATSGKSYAAKRKNDIPPKLNSPSFFLFQRTDLYSNRDDKANYSISVRLWPPAPSVLIIHLIIEPEGGEKNATQTPVQYGGGVGLH